MECIIKNQRDKTEDNEEGLIKLMNLEKHRLRDREGEGNGIQHCLPTTKKVCSTYMSQFLFVIKN